jgi:hypothetical protein
MLARTAALLVLSASSVLAAGTASASPPDRFVEASKEDFEFTVDCGTFDAHVAGTVTDRITVFFDSEGEVTRFTQVVSAPRDVWTNVETGESIVVRGHFVQHHDRVPGTNAFDRTVTGFRYMVNEPGRGVTIKDAGRIVYDDLEESTWRDLAGRHDFADGTLIEPTMCAALA